MFALLAAPVFGLLDLFNEDPARLTCSTVIVADRNIIGSWLDR